MSYDEVAEFFGVSKRTITRWTSRRISPLACIKVGGVVRFAPSDVRAFVEAYRRERRVKTVGKVPADYLPPFIQPEASWDPS